MQGAAIIDSTGGEWRRQVRVAAPATDAGAGRSEAARRALRVLIVEDDVVTALGLEDLVLERGHAVVDAVASGPAAVAAASAHLPDVVLMDIRLARGTDGVAAAVEIRNRFDIPAIFLSAHSDPETRERADAARPIGYLVKPFSTDEIVALIDRAADGIGDAG